MKSVEYWVLRIADSDATWIGLGWLRPAVNQRVGFPYILFSSLLLGLPAIILGAGLVYIVLGRLDPRFCLSLFLLVLLIELALHGLFAHFWNRRAAALAETSRQR